MSKRNKIALVLNAIIVLLEIIGFVIALSINGWGVFVFYTQESNLVLLVCSLIYVIMAWKHREGELPRWVSVMKYLATSLVLVTFLIVIFVLIPMCYPDREMMLHVAMGDASLYHHMSCPILAIVSFIFFEERTTYTRKDNIIATIPTLMYAIVTTTLNVAGLLYGPYPFLYVYEQPVWASVLWFIGIVGAGYLFALVIRVLKKRCQ